MADNIDWIANCCHCGRIVDTRDKSSGGDEFGNEHSPGEWTCSVDCYEAVVDPSAIEERKPVVSIKTMRLSDGSADHYVSIRVGDRQSTPHKLREEYQAAWHVAHYDWLLNGGDKPDLMAFGPSGWPAQLTELVGGDLASLTALSKENARLHDELEDALRAPWPEWASSIHKRLLASGHDAVGDGETVDLAEAFSDYLDGIDLVDQQYKADMLRKDGEIARLRVAADYIAPYLQWTVGPESTYQHPSLPSAVGAFLAAFDIDTADKRLRRVKDLLRAEKPAPWDGKPPKLADAGDIGYALEELKAEFPDRFKEALGNPALQDWFVDRIVEKFEGEVAKSYVSTVLHAIFDFGKEP